MYYIYKYRKGYYMRTKTIRCIECNEFCGSGRKFCKKCLEIVKNRKKEVALNKTIKEACYTKGHISNKYALIRDHCRREYENKIKKCQKCGYDKHVEFCHIRPIKDFPDSTTIREVNSPENIIALCPNCHWEFDHPK